MAWNTPLTWAIRDPITATKLNAQLRDNSNYLFARPRTLITQLGAGSDLTTASATFVAVDDAQFTANLTTSGGLVEVNLSAVIAHSVLSAFVYFDVIIDDVTYVSSQTGTPLTNGLWGARETLAAAIISVPSQPFIYPLVLSSGVHTFKLRWRTSVATATLKLSAGNVFQFSVKEI